jgi:hypothetical protein
MPSASISTTHHRPPATNIIGKIETGLFALAVTCVHEFANWALSQNSLKKMGHGDRWTKNPSAIWAMTAHPSAYHAAQAAP